MEKCRQNESVALLLKLLDVPSSSYYYAVANPLKNITELAKYKGLRIKIERIIRKHPGYGYRRIKIQLGKQGITINSKPLKKLLKLWNLKRIRRVKYPKPSPLAQSIKDLGAKINLVGKLKRVNPLQVIFTDFTRIVCEAGIFQLIIFHDKVSRRIVGWNISPNADTANAIKAYRMVRRYLKRMKVDLSKVIIHQDQDTVFTGYQYAGMILNDGVTLSFTQRGFKDNSQMESCNSRLKEEYSDQMAVAQSDDELKKIIRRIINLWNKERIHSGLKGRSPDEFIHIYFELKKNK